MSRSTPPFRIGDAEREAALGALGEHLAAGRLTMDEYGERTTRAASAQTYGELLAVFTDLPGPQPALDLAVDLRKTPENARQRPLGTLLARDQQLAPRIFHGLGAIAILVWLILLVTGHGQFWWLIFVPAIFYVFASQVWPSDARQRCAADRDDDARHGTFT
ncbi:DUF1707 SHOCT-like domain-containing protein [Fodinicola feengrottensis]|uniref:DUF1707 SHOCT-like domain-containing protein n=1 Tax=Fodinicola feengrottensis TaxID=435914 RepID=UPI0013D135E6|nr:DUF1707 domain-containing protein [Fodinicola feengrottensis]